jgi:tetratricopeptide (TPR) repeat protein
MDEERLRELIALGYISPKVLEERRRRGGAPAAAEEAAAPPAAPAQDAAAVAAGLEAVSTEAFNLGAIHQRQGDFAAARRQYEIAVERLPSFGQAWAALAQIASLSGSPCEAMVLLVRGFGQSRTMPNWGLTGLVEEGKKCGRLAEAERALEKLRPAYERDSAFHAALGLAAAANGRPDAALEHHRRALAIDPLDQLANEETVALLRQLGREAEARRFLDEAFARAQGKVTAMNQLAVVALRQGWSADAERLLRRVLASDPGNPGVLANLAAALMQQGKRDQAAAMMREAVQRDPGNARNHFNLGAMLAEEGRFAEALAAFETAGEKGLRSPQVHIAAAKMHFRLGDRGKSAAELEKALALDPGNREAQQMLAALRSG